MTSDLDAAAKQSDMEMHDTMPGTLLLDSIEQAIAAAAEGKLVIIVDDEDRENEGDLFVAAAKVTQEQVAFMIQHTCGILCVPLLPQRAETLRLDQMVPNNDAPLGTAFTVSVDYKLGLTTGISATERTNTVRALANGNVAAADFARPGHIFPLLAKQGGVLMRSGHTEAAIDLARLAGLPPVGLIAELVNDDGSVKRLPELLKFAREYELCIISIADLIAYRQQREQLVQRVGEFDVDTEIGRMQTFAFKTPFDDAQHLALIHGDLEYAPDEPVVVRIHREQIIPDVFGSRQGRDANIVSTALRRIGRENKGVFIYLREGSPGVTVPELDMQAESSGHPARASEQARKGLWREIGIGAQILRSLGIHRIMLLTTQRLHYVGLPGFGITIEGTETLS